MTGAMLGARIVPENISEALAAVGLRRGDTVLLHSDAIVAAQLPPMPEPARLDAVIDSVQNILGPDGTLVMPSFSYSFTKNEAFDVRHTPSTVGMLTERFRTRAGVLRSSDPIFSFAASGLGAQELASLPGRECFGADSAFAVLHRRNALIVCLGCSLSSGGTFIHYVEKSHGVNYRYDKEFSGVITRADGSSISTSVVYYVRDLARNSVANLKRLHRRLETQRLLRTASLGRFQVLGVRAADWFTTASDMLDQDPVALIEEGAAEELLQKR